MVFKKFKHLYNDFSRQDEYFHYNKVKREREEKGG